MKLSRKWIIGITLLLVLGGSVAAYMVFAAKEGAKETTETFTVTRCDIKDTVTAQGTLEPKDYVDVGVQVSGQIKKLYVDIGDVVKQGDLLAELDPLVYQSLRDGDAARLNSLKAQLEQQKAQTEFDRLQHQRAIKLAKAGATARSDLEEKDKALKVSEATMKSLEAQIAEAQAALNKDIINLGYTKIYAPMSGIVSDRKAREGQTLNANQTTPTILQIANLDVMTIRAEIAEADVVRLKSGMAASFTTMGEQERKWMGTIRQILPTPEVVNDVVLYNALIDVENKDGQLMNGMTAQVFFVTQSADNTLCLPPRALGRLVPTTKRDSEKSYSVLVQHGGAKPEERVATVGLMTRTAVQILRGLSEGDQVIVKKDSSGTSSDGEAKTKSQRTGPPGMGAHL
ncbi:MAG: efflux RND transporter periplasmic adaptor subunit [Alphaproteobacteria bacterium]|nr:efflux RND transporter periplasmic adaptor subunit [Alphaproteobacteria bacterium]